jgi:hypothetical protein
LGAAVLPDMATPEVPPSGTDPAGIGLGGLVASGAPCGTRGRFPPGWLSAITRADVTWTVGKPSAFTLSTPVTDTDRPKKSRIVIAAAP